jgi:hypothetical protein
MGGSCRRCRSTALRCCCIRREPDSRGLPNPEKLVIDVVAWLPDSRRIVLFGQKPGQPSRGFVQDIDGGPPKPFTPEQAGVRATRWWTLPVSPDGARVIASGADERSSIIQLSDGSSTPVPGLGAGEVVVQWLDDGDVLVAPANDQPWTLQRLNLKTGRRSAGLDIRPTDRAGLRLSVVGVATDGRHYVHSYSRLLSNLFVVDGLR